MTSALALQVPPPAPLQSPSLAEILALQPEVANDFFGNLSEEEARALHYDWRFWARPKQLAPGGSWVTWLILAGRGFGKTRTGAEWVTERVESGLARRIALVAETSADARDVMVEGPSGVLACAKPWNPAKYEPSKRRVTWANGAQATTFSADEPDQIRGPEHDTAWGDEVAKWRYEEAWDNLQFGLRIGKDPRCVATTTPKPTKLVRALVRDTETAITRGATDENRGNLAPKFLKAIYKKYDGTRLGRQELAAELLEDAPGALWKREQIDRFRVRKHPDLVRVVVAIDPSVSATSENAETGIVVAGVDADGEGYLLADGSLPQPTPEAWGSAAVSLYNIHQADRIIGEVNNGGDLVESNVRAIDKKLPFQQVRASRGKAVRAEPIATIAEKGRIHHVGAFGALEDELCFVAGTLITLRRGEIPIEQVRVGDEALTRSGWRKVTRAGQTGVAKTHRLSTAKGHELIGTAGHPVLTVEHGFLPLARASIGTTLLECLAPASSGSPSSKDVGTTSTRGIATGSRAAQSEAGCYTSTSGSPRMVRSPKGGTCTTRTRTEATTHSRISRHYLPASTSKSMAASEEPSLGASSKRAHRSVASGQAKSLESASAPTAANGTYPPDFVHCTADRVVASAPTQRPPEPVFNLTVDAVHEYVANGLVVHNCQWEPGAEKSPNRLDAYVWAFTALMLGEGMIDVSEWVV